MPDLAIADKVAATAFLPRPRFPGAREARNLKHRWVRGRGGGDRYKP